MTTHHTLSFGSFVSKPTVKNFQCNVAYIMWFAGRSLREPVKGDRGQTGAPGLPGLPGLEGSPGTQGSPGMNAFDCYR